MNRFSPAGWLLCKTNLSSHLIHIALSYKTCGIRQMLIRLEKQYMIVCETCWIRFSQIC